MDSETTFLYCRVGSADKVYGAGLVITEVDTATFVACWGPRGGVGRPTVQTGPAATMRRAYAAKVREKTREYRDLRTVAADAGATLTGPEAAAAIAHLCTVLGGAGGHPALATPTRAEGGGIIPAVPVPLPAPGPQPSRVLPLPAGINLAALLADPAWGVTEKVNGRRCLVERTAAGLVAYNRRGGVVAVPAAAEPLQYLPVGTVVDGEALERNQAGEYVLFDLLADGGRAVRAQPYQARIARLAALLGVAGLQVGMDPMLAAARSGPRIPPPDGSLTAPIPTPGLFLLTAATSPALKHALAQQVQATGGEGIILRRLDGPSLAGDTPHERKVKFQAEIDVVVLAHTQRPGQTVGALTIGVRREADSAWIALGSVGTGLDSAQFAAVVAALQRGHTPVLRVEYLAARTVGIAPVEPVVREVRDDKAPADCGASQLLQVLGGDRAALIAAAPAWSGPHPTLAM